MKQPRADTVAWRGTLALLALLLGGYLPALAQQAAPFSDTLTTPAGGLDSLRLRQQNLAPGSLAFTINGQPVPRSQWQLDYSRGVVRFVPPLPGGAVVVTEGRSFGWAMSEEVSLRKLNIIQKDSSGNDVKINIDSLSLYTVFKNDEQVVYVDKAAKEREDFEREKFYEQQELVARGSISRSVTVGSNSDLAVNSDFRLQLEGNVARDVQVLASITDENIPIQPSGTTQTITDFDKVYVQLKKGKLSLTLGDFEISQTGTNFLNVYRNVLGVGFRSDGRYNKYFAAVNLAKGKFHTNTLVAENGKQGPYRLNGRDNEQFIIILAGSEKVYINGALMTRGEDRDYVIEYNTGEITFTANRVITSNMRIVVDFEYAERNYSRSFWFGSFQSSIFKDRLKLRVSYGREADDPNAPIDATLGPKERAALRDAGDNPLNAVIDGADSVGYQNNQVLYAKTDTTLGSRTYPSVYRYTTDSSGAWRVFFTYVGPGKGYYRKDLTSVNGRVFTWVAPDTATGVLLGDYAPIRAIPLPRLLQVVGLTAEFKVTEHLSVFSETGISIDDKNRESDINDDDNVGVANRSGLRLTQQPLSSNKQLRLSAEAAVQYVGARFTNFDRVYQLEYGRAWNYDDQASRLKDELLGEGSVELLWQKRLRVRASAGYRTLGDSLRTLRQLYEVESLDSTVITGKYSVTVLNTDITPSSAVLSKSSSFWIRQNADLYRVSGKYFKPGVELWFENKVDKAADTMSLGSLDFQDIKPYFRSVNTTKVRWDVYFNWRHERAFLEGQYRDKQQTYTGYAQAAYTPIPQLTVQATGSYVRFLVEDTVFTRAQDLKNSETFMANIQSYYNHKKRLVQTSFLYQVLTERVARREIFYREVTPGLGQYTWIDYNSNGRQELNEFEVSINPLTANYVRLLLPTNELYPAVSLDMGLTLRLDFGQVVKKSASPLRQLIKNTTTLTSIQANQKRSADEMRPLDYLIRFNQFDDRDTSVLTANYTIRQDFFFFRNSSVAEVSFSLLENATRQFLSSGLEQRGLRTYTLRNRVNIGQNKSVETQLVYTEKHNKAYELTARDYNIQGVTLNPSFNIQLTRKMRLSSGYEFKWKRNSITSDSSDSRIFSHKIIADWKWNIKDRNNIFARVELFRIDQAGVPNNAANFEMLEGMGAGNNAVWNVFASWYVTKAIELSVIYDGRASQDKPVVHSARMQVRAVF